MVKINNQDITQNMMLFQSHYFKQYEVNYAYFYNNEYLTVKCDKNGIDTDVSCVNCIRNKTGMLDYKHLINTKNTLCIIKNTL